MNFMTFPSYWEWNIIPTDFNSIIFQRGRAQPPTRCFSQLLVTSFAMVNKLSPKLNEILPRQVRFTMIWIDDWNPSHKHGINMVKLGMVHYCFTNTLI